MPKTTSIGKPTLFFREIQNEKKWRKTEKIVAIIESYLQDVENVYTFSSVDIKNVVEDPTEIDVAFSNIDDPAEFFNFVQVRDRSGGQGRPWVEQVIGQKNSLGINNATMVSTSSFSGEAIRLAKNQEIKLRLLLPESIDEIKKWFKPDYIGLEQPLTKIIHCSLLTSKGKQVQELKTDNKNLNEKSVLLPTQKPNEFHSIPLTKVFDVDVLQNPDRKEELFERIIPDNEFHEVTLAIEYKNPRLFAYSEGEILPIRVIIFKVQVKNHKIFFPIEESYKYLDADSSELLAQATIFVGQLSGQKYYATLIRHKCENSQCLLGGAFYQ